jgi:nicotinamide-nucleotide amidase
MDSLAAALVGRARVVLAACAAEEATLALAESCTGGLLTAALTAIPGSSAFVERGFITYSNAAKTELLGVPADLIARVGAVSEEVARAMAAGALAHSPATFSAAITGIAGPDGGTPAKPVGTVHLAAARRDGRILYEHRLFPGNRDAIRLASALAAMDLLIQQLSGGPA